MNAPAFSSSSTSPVYPPDAFAALVAGSLAGADQRAALASTTHSRPRARTRITSRTWDPVPSDLEQSLATLVPMDLIQAETPGAHFGYVDIDQVVVHQPFVDLSHILRLHEATAPIEAIEELTRGLLQIAPPPIAPYGRPDSIEFWTESNDFRFLGVAVAQNGGRVSATVELGYTPNTIAVLSFDGNLYLHNGTHRAYLMRCLGHSRIPILVRPVPTFGELVKILGPAAMGLHQQVRSNAAHRFAEYLDPGSTVVLRKIREVTRVDIRSCSTTFADMRFDAANEPQVSEDTEAA